MNRRLLLTLAGLGTSAAAVFLMSGTAHALAPPPADRPPVPPVHLTIPSAPDVGTVKTVTTKVVHEVKQAPPVEEVVESVPVVVKRVTATLDPSLPTLPTAAHRPAAVAPSRLRATRSAHSIGAAAPAFAAVGSPRGPAMRGTRTRGPSPGSTLAFMLPGLSDNALTPAQSSVGSPFAALATRTLHISTVTQWLTFPTADRTRPGFLVGSARPG